MITQKYKCFDNIGLSYQKEEGMTIGEWVKYEVHKIFGTEKNCE